MQGAQKPEREAYALYVERYGLQRNAVDGYFSTAPTSVPYRTYLFSPAEQ